jgi:hypothetical protein
MKTVAMTMLLLGLVSCGGAPVAETPKKFALPDLPRAIAEEVKFPSANRKAVAVVQKEMLGLPYLGGGNVAEYETGKQKYKLLLIRCKSAGQAGNYIFDIKNEMGSPKFVASYGGYFAEKTSAGPLLVFAKGSYIGGIAGLTEEEAIQTGKEFAARIPY